MPPPKKILNLPEHPPTPINATLLKICEDLTHPLKCTLTQKGKDSFLKEQKILFPTMKREHIWTFEIWVQSCKILKSKES